MSKVHLKYDSASALTNNQVVKYITSESGVTTSIIYDDGTNLGIGTTNPSRKIDSIGTFNFEPVSGTTYFRYDSFMFEMVKNANNLLRINNDNEGISQLFGSKRVTLYNPTSAGSYAIDLTSTSIIDNTQISFKRSDSYHFGLWDTVNYRLAIGGLGTIPQTSAITATLDIRGAGSTSGTTGLSVTNSAGANVLVARDDGAVISNQGYWIYNGGVPEKTVFRNGYYSYAFGAGSLATNAGNGNLALGYSVMAGLSGPLTGNANIGIGGSNMSYLTTGSGNIAIGNGTFSGMYLSGDNNIGIGNNAINNNGGINSSIALGANSKLFGSNQFVIGSASDPINDIYLGRGMYDITGGLTQGSITIHATGVQGGGGYTNVSTSAMSLTIAGSQGTGTGTGGDIIFKTAPAGSSGDSQNSLVEIVRVTSESKVGINNSNPSEKLDVVGNVKFSGQSYNPVYSAGTIVSTYIPNWNLSNIQSFTLSSATTNMSGGTNIKDGSVYTMILKQDNTGSRLVNWGSNYKWQSGIPPVLTTTSDSTDIITFISDGTNLYGLIAKDFR